MMPWLDDASAVADAVRTGDVKAADAVEASLQAIQKSQLNTIVHLDAEGARRQAEAIDERVNSGGDPGLWAGVPLLVKDMEDAAGVPTSYGSVGVQNKNAGRDWTHPEPRRAAGAVR